MPAEGAGNNETVLVVDDDDEVRRFLVTVLSRQGYRIIESSSGIEALSQLQRDRPGIDILVTDISLLDTDGIALAEHFIARCPGAGVVFMSGFTEIPRPRLESLPARWAFVPKPFHVQKLLDAVHTILTEAGGARAA
jgi:DNA-binding NtrC family response regulator